jgi:hypothetical protein
MTTSEFLTANRSEIIEDIKYFIEENNIVYVTLSEVMVMFKNAIEEKGTDKWGIANVATIDAMKTLENERFTASKEDIQINSIKNQAINL